MKKKGKCGCGESNMEGKISPSGGLGGGGGRNEEVKEEAREKNDGYEEGQKKVYTLFRKKKRKMG